MLKMHIIKLYFLEDIMAAKEINVAKTYLSLKKYISAIKRFKNIVNNYQTSSYVPELSPISRSLYNFRC